MKEEWRDIKGYEGKYQVSNLGRVKSLNYHRADISRILAVRKDKGGYLYLNLYKNNKRKTYKVHRLVAEAFIDNPNNYPQVNHKDEIRSNNIASNLEWCDSKYNNNYGTRKDKIKGSKNPAARKVQCITTGKKFNTVKEASKYYFVSRQSISSCCSNNLKSAGKHPVTGEKLIWKYID